MKIRGGPPGTNGHMPTASEILKSVPRDRRFALFHHLARDQKRSETELLQAAAKYLHDYPQAQIDNIIRDGRLNDADLGDEIRHPELGRALRNIALASNKPHALEAEALRLSPFVASSEIPKADAVDVLCQCVDPNWGIRRSDAEHIVGMGLGGIQTLLRKAADDQGPHAKPERGSNNGSSSRHNPNRGHAHTYSQNNSPSAERQKKESVLVTLSTIKPRATDWIWVNRIPRGALTINTGQPGTGKSQQGIDAIAHVTTGTPWPDGAACPCGNAILLTAEDDLANTVVPRLMAAGADLTRVSTLQLIRIDARTQRAFLLQEDIDVLDRHLNDRGDIVLVVIDPITAFLGTGKVDSNKAADIRGVLGPLAALAERHNVAIYAITHPPKSTTSTINSFIGSQAFIAAARVGYLTIEEIDQEGKPTGRVLVAMVKTNLGPRMPTLAYRLAQLAVAEDDRDGRIVVGSHVVWDQEVVEVTADQALMAAAGNGNAKGRTATDDAVDFLKAVITEPRSVKKLEAEAQEAGLLKADQPIQQCKPFRDAKNRLGVVAYQKKGEKAGGWVWAMPIRCPRTGQMP
jgi:AAA domain